MHGDPSSSGQGWLAVLLCPSGCCHQSLPAAAGYAAVQLASWGTALHADTTAVLMAGQVNRSCLHRLAQLQVAHIAVHHSCSVAAKNTLLCTQQNLTHDNCLRAYEPQPHSSSVKLFQTPTWSCLSSAEPEPRRPVLRPEDACAAPAGPNFWYPPQMHPPSFHPPPYLQQPLPPQQQQHQGFGPPVMMHPPPAPAIMPPQFEPHAGLYERPDSRGRPPWGGRSRSPRKHVQGTSNAFAAQVKASLQVQTHRHRLYTHARYGAITDA